MVERFNSFTSRRSDLFQFIDCLAICPGQTVGIQTTSTSNVSARKRKILCECRDNALAWLRAGNRIVIHGWSKRKVKRGGVAMRWTLKEIAITEADFGED